MSNIQIAYNLKTRDHTVTANTDKFATGKFDQLQKTMGGDGRDRPSSEEQAEQQRQEIRETDEQAEQKCVTSFCYN